MIFAWNIPWIVVMYVFPVLGSLAITYHAIGSVENLKNPTMIAWSGLLFILVTALLFFAGGIFIAGFLSPLYKLNEKLNGGPFEDGDEVIVLAGKHKGKITNVYSEWQGMNVRIKLSESEKENFKDVFPSSNLLKTEKLNRGRISV